MVKKLVVSRELYSNMTVTRMRYRGPMESYKVNKFESDIRKDIKILSDKVGIVGQRVEQFISESIFGSRYDIVVCNNGATVYNGSEACDLELINNVITELLEEGK